MELFPPMPNWEAAHPLVVHFPIALLMLAWVPMLIGLLDSKRRWAWMVAALLMLLAGTAGAFVAVISGEASEDKVVVLSEVVDRAISEHEHMGEFARTLAVAATALFVVVLGLGAGLKKGKGKTIALVIGGVVFLGVYGICVNRLAWAGHMGGELVHVHGVLAPMQGPPPEMIEQGLPGDPED